MTSQAIEEKRSHQKPNVYRQDIPEGSQPRASAYKTLFVTNPDVEDLPGDLLPLANLRQRLLGINNAEHDQAETPYVCLIFIYIRKAL
jgi:hypothetical protein